MNEQHPDKSIEDIGQHPDPWDPLHDACSDLGTDGRAVCDEGLYCEKHYQEAAAEHAYLANVPQSYVTGKYSDEERQDLIDAGRGHLLPPE